MKRVLYLTPVELWALRAIEKIEKTKGKGVVFRLPSPESEMGFYPEFTEDTGLKRADYENLMTRLMNVFILKVITRVGDENEFVLCQFIHPLDDFLIVELPVSGRMCVETAPEYIEIVNKMLAGEGPNHNDEQNWMRALSRWLDQIGFGEISTQSVIKKTGEYNPGRLARMEGKEHWGIWRMDHDGTWHLAVKGFLPVELVSSGKSARRIKKTTHATSETSSPPDTTEATSETSSPPDTTDPRVHLKVKLASLRPRVEEYTRALADEREAEKRLEQARANRVAKMLSPEEVNRLFEIEVELCVLEGLERLKALKER